jgi:hypothetical protein
VSVWYEQTGETTIARDPCNVPVSRSAHRNDREAFCSEVSLSGHPRDQGVAGRHRRGAGEVAHSQRREGKEIRQNRCGLQVQQPIPPTTPYEPWNRKIQASPVLRLASRSTRAPKAGRPQEEAMKIRFTPMTLVANRALAGVGRATKAALLGGGIVALLLWCAPGEAAACRPACPKGCQCRSGPDEPLPRPWCYCAPKSPASAKVRQAPKSSTALPRPVSATVTAKRR